MTAETLNIALQTKSQFAEEKNIFHIFPIYLVNSDADKTCL